MRPATGQKDSRFVNRETPGSAGQSATTKEIPDWRGNWVSSIAIKITAPLLWFLVFIGTAISFLLSGDVRTNLNTMFVNKADHYAYEISRSVTTQNKSLDTLGENLFLSKGSIKPFEAIEINYGDKTWKYGIKTGDDEVLTRRLLVGVAPDGLISGKAPIVKFFHRPIGLLVKKERAHILVTAAVPLVILGIALSLLINKIIVDPIRNLVEATRRISAGDINLRLNSDRQDEFGHLEQFFDKMLDQLQDQKDQLQEALESARDADRTKSQFLANMSHELRTPLNAIIGYSELIMEAEKDAASSDKTNLKDLVKIRSSGLHLLSLINDILDIAKIESGKMQIAKSRFEIQAMLEDVESTSRPLMLQNHNQVRFSCPENIGSMISDELRIRQVLINLMSNAAKFTREGSVELLVGRYEYDGNDWIRFEVKDTGIGISDADSVRLFNEFAQVEDHIKGKPAGTGLGLAISQKFCGLMGGRIRLESKPGSGSTFYVELPTVVPV